MILNKWIAFHSAFFEYPPKWCIYSAGWCHMKLVSSRRKFCVHHTTNQAPCHFMQSHIRKVYTCLAVTCRMHFWQNDRDLLRATAVRHLWCVLPGYDEVKYDDFNVPLGSWLHTEQWRMQCWPSLKNVTLPFSHACCSGVRTVCESLILYCAMLVHRHRFEMVLTVLCTLLLLGVKRVGRDTTFTLYHLNTFTAMVSLESNQ